MRPLKPSRQNRSLDISLAMALLCGIRHGDRLPKFQFLSRHTRPTEKEARNALARVLLSGRVPPVILQSLASVFAPECDSPMRRLNQRQIIFKNINQGHSNPERDWEIAYWVDELRRNGSSYDDATGNVATNAKLSIEQVKRICGKVKLGFDPPPRARRKSPHKR